MSKRILNIEDDRDLGNLIKLNLADFQVDHVPDGKAGLEVAMCSEYDLLILDLMLPGIDGVEVCRALRAANRTIPILMLTARDTETDRVLGLEIGADDYLTKPFSVRELQARVKAMLRRVEMQHAGPSRSRIMEFAGLHIDMDRRQVNCGGRQVDLTSTEFDLLAHLASNPGHVFNRSRLLSAPDRQYVFESSPSHPEYVLTVWGVGYKFSEDMLLR